MILPALKKCLNPVQRSFNLVQRCLNLVQWRKRVAAVKVPQFIIVKDNTAFGVAFVSSVKMAIRWIDAKQRAITERVQAFVTSGFPVMGVPCPAGAFVTVAPKQLLPAVSTTPLLPLPSLLYSVARKSRHGRTSQATHDVRIKGGYRVWTRIKNGWSQTASDNEWVRMVDGKETRLTIVKAPPWPPENKRARTTYAIWYNGRDVGHAYTRKQAISKAEAFFKKVKHA